MTKLAILFVGLLGLAACNTTGMGTGGSVVSPVDAQVATPTDGAQTGPDV